MGPELEQYCRESAKSCDTVPDVHPDDFIFEYIAGHPGFSDPREAVSYYFNDGRHSAHQLREILSNDLGIAPSTALSLVEFASGYCCVTRHLAKILEDENALPTHFQGRTFSTQFEDPPFWVCSLISDNKKMKQCFLAHSCSVFRQKCRV
jgi:hypothetical protein